MIGRDGHYLGALKSTVPGLAQAPQEMAKSLSAAEISLALC